jgi:hypothetical protein
MIHLNKLENILDTLSPYYVVLITIFHILNFLYIILFSLFGIVIVEQIYIKYYSRFTQTFVCLFLIIKFHPFRKHVLKDGDSTIIFASAFILLINLGLFQYMNVNMQTIESTLNEIV